MKSLVSPYFAEYQDKEVKFSTKKLVQLMAQCFYFNVLHSDKENVKPTFERFIDKDTKTGYVRLTFSSCRVDSDYAVNGYVDYTIKETMLGLLGDFNLENSVLDLTPEDFQKWFLEELKSLVDQEEGVTLVAEESVVQSPYDNSDDENYTIQLTLDVDLPNLEVEKEPEGEEEQDGEETVE
jgi:hypothetical protein